MGLASTEDDRGDIFDPPADRWQLVIWEQSQEEIRVEKERLIADIGAERINRDQFATSLTALNKRAAEIYQRLLAEEKQKQSVESAE